jgi:hypothetical protein
VSHQAKLIIQRAQAERAARKTAAETEEADRQLYAEFGQLLDSFVGQKGDKGDSIQGPKGDPGEPGKDGKDGKDGAQGVKGDPGIDGKDGADGRDGRNGTDGIAGLRGRDGRDGDVRVVKQAYVESIELKKDYEGYITGAVYTYSDGTTKVIDV